MGYFFAHNPKEPMLKRMIKYKNFDDVEVEEVYHFNLSKTELATMLADGKNLFWEEIMASEDKSKLFDEFKKLILATYGERDGDQFKKTPEIAEAFTFTAAFDALIFELLTDEKAAADFVKDVLPDDLEKIAAEAAERQAAAQIAAAQAKAAESAPA